MSDTEDIENINGTTDKGRHIQKGGQKTQQMATENQNKSSKNRTSRKMQNLFQMKVTKQMRDGNVIYTMSTLRKNQTKYWNAHTVHNTSAYNALICQQNYMTS